MVNGDFSEIFNFFSSTFGVPSQWFEGPGFIFFFVIPLISMIAFWYFMLNNRLRFFKSSSANFIIALVVTLMSTAVFNFIPGHPTTTLIIGILGALFFEGGFSLSRIIIAVVLSILIGFGFPILMEYTMTYV